MRKPLSWLAVGVLVVVGVSLGAPLALGWMSGTSTPVKEDEHEKKVTIDQVPEAVRATILKEAGKNKIEEIEEETKNGVTVYEAEWHEGGKEVEIKVAADGKLLKKEIEDDDEDDDDDD